MISCFSCEEQRAFDAKTMQIFAERGADGLISRAAILFDCSCGVERQLAPISRAVATAAEALNISVWDVPEIVGLDDVGTPPEEPAHITCPVCTERLPIETVRESAEFKLFAVDGETRTLFSFSCETCDSISRFWVDGSTVDLLRQFGFTPIWGREATLQLSCASCSSIAPDVPDVVLQVSFSSAKRNRIKVERVAFLLMCPQCGDSLERAVHIGENKAVLKELLKALTASARQGVIYGSCRLFCGTVVLATAEEPDLYIGMWTEGDDINMLCPCPLCSQPMLGEAAHIAQRLLAAAGFTLVAQQENPITHAEVEAFTAELRDLTPEDILAELEDDEK